MLSLTFHRVGPYPFNAVIVVEEMNTLKQVIALVSLYRPGSPGLGYLSMLAGAVEPRMVGLGAIRDVQEEEVPTSFNAEQRAAVFQAIRRPSISYVQGIPGSGKTHLLSVIAQIYSRRGKDVVVMALTHQAVNNALNKIVSLSPDVPVAKIGKAFKNIGLNSRVVQTEGFKEYLGHRRNTGGFFNRTGCVVGMTFQAALSYLGEGKSAFTPQVILFDEAGQLPFTHGVAIGAFRCGSVVFIGDDVQMPPIYHPILASSPLSRSMFEHVKSVWPKSGQVLNVTYRMCFSLAQFVSERYYKPKGICLVSDTGATGNRLLAEGRTWLPEGSGQVEFVECSCPGAKDENKAEAEAVCRTVEDFLRKGLPVNRIAVITPYRRQVRLIRNAIKACLGEKQDLPLVDTVERLQGQDVDVLLASFATDSTQYFETTQSFLLNANRLNVMFSRATCRVVVFGSVIVRLALNM